MNVGMLVLRENWAQTSDLLWQGIIELRDDSTQRRLGSDFSDALAGDN